VTHIEQSGNIPYIAPANPGVHPVHLAGATAAQMTEANHDHQSRTLLFDQYNAVEQALKHQLLAAIPNEFIRPLTNELTQYTTVSVLTILTHLDTRYGHITENQLCTNKENMDHTWSTMDSFDSFWHHIHQCRLVEWIKVPIIQIPGWSEQCTEYLGDLLVGPELANLFVNLLI
jgi:predicted acyl esterase